MNIHHNDTHDRDIHHKGIDYKDTHSKDIQHNNIQHKDTLQNDTQLMTECHAEWCFSEQYMLSVVKLSVIMLIVVASRLPCLNFFSLSFSLASIS
jgi:hypothetical protein